MWYEAFSVKYANVKVTLINYNTFLMHYFDYFKLDIASVILGEKSYFSLLRYGSLS